MKKGKISFESLILSEQTQSKTKSIELKAKKFLNLYNIKKVDNMINKFIRRKLD